MVPVSALITITITLLITLVAPIAIFIFYGIRHSKEGIWSALALGALGFFVMQMVIRIPILQALSLLPGFVAFANNHYVIYSLILAFTAGLFELVGRYVVAKLMAKRLTYHRSVAAGLGHGGIEAILLVGMTYINNLLYSFMINTGAFDALINQVSTSVDVYPLISIKETLIETPAAIYLLAGYERILTMICHLAMTLIVCYFVAKKQDIKGVVICLALHTLLDAGAGLIPYFVPISGENATLGYIAIYAFLTIMAVISCFIIGKIASAFKVSAPATHEV